MQIRAFPMYLFINDFLPGCLFALAVRPAITVPIDWA